MNLQIGITSDFVENPSTNFALIRFYLRENPSEWMGCFPVPSLNPNCTPDEGINSLNQLCVSLNKQLPHLYHYVEVFDV